MSEAFALPRELQPFAGRINDVDSHEMICADKWVEIFGEDVRGLADMLVKNPDIHDGNDKNSPCSPGYEGDVAEITPDVLDKKGNRAPGALDFGRRLEVMNAAGIDRQLMFPSGPGLWGMICLMQDAANPALFKNLPGDHENHLGQARRWLARANAWVLTDPKFDRNRIRPVPPIMADTVEQLMADTREVLEMGARAIFIPAGQLPGGKSPAHSDLDPFWEMLVDANCVATIHLGGEPKFLEQVQGWGDAPAFKGYRNMLEFSADPWTLSMLHVPCSNFIATMVTGGVFERHPKLRVGVIELGAYWVGPMMDMLDMWHENLGFFSGLTDRANRKPSDYVKSNVRVSCFSFEPIDKYLRCFDVEDILCFSSDYPHVEGGRDMFNVIYKKIAPFGPAVMEKFFVTNGQFLLPD